MIDGQRKILIVFVLMASEKICMKYSRIFLYIRSEIFSQWLGSQKAKYLFLFVDIHIEVATFTSSVMTTWSYQVLKWFAGLWLQFLFKMK